MKKAIDTSTIVNRLRDQWQRKARDEELASQLNLYIPTTLGTKENECPENRKNGAQEIKDFLNNGHRLLLLLGDSGTGKSLFGQWLANSLWENPDEWVPLYIHLPSLKMKPDFLEAHLENNHGLSNADIESLRITKKLFIIFDAYDEIKLKNQNINLFKQGKLYRWKVRAMITCRSELFNSLHSTQQQKIFSPYQDENIPLNHSWGKRYVQCFDRESDIPKYTHLWMKFNTNLIDRSIDYPTVLNTLPGLAEMITNPFILSIALSWLPKIHRKFYNKPLLERYNLTRMGLFDTFTQAWFERQRDKLLDNKRISKAWAKTIVEDFQCYCEELANLMRQRNVNCAKYKPEEDRPDDEWKLFFSPTGYFNGDRNKPLALIRQGALLRTLEANTYIFWHDSLLTYFSDKLMFNSSIDQASMTLGHPFNSTIFINDKERLGNAIDMLHEVPGFEQVLWAILEESRYDARVETAAANAISILAAANISFAGKDLRRVRIRYANLFSANFDGANLSEADLRDVNISDAWISHANISNCLMDGIKTHRVFEEDYDKPIRSCGFTPNGLYYYVRTREQLKIYDTTTHKIINTISLRFGEKRIHQYVFSPSSDFVLITTNKVKCTAYNITSGIVIHEWQAWGNILAISHDARWVLMEDSETATIKQWEITSGQCMQTWQGDTSNLIIVSLLNDKIAVSCSNDGTIQRWEISSGKCLASWQGHSDPICGLVFNSDTTAITYSSDGTIKKWDAQSGQCLLTFLEQHPKISDLELCSDKTLGLSSSEDGTIKRWNLNTGQCLAIWPGPKEISKIIFSADHSWALTMSSHDIRRWEVTTGQCVAKWDYDDAVSMALSPDENWVLSCHNNEVPGKMSYLSNYCIKRFETAIPVKQDSKYRTLKGVKLSKDTQWILSEGKLWETATGRCILVMKDTKSTISDKFGTQPTWIFANMDNKSARVNPSKGKKTIILRGHQGIALTSVNTLDGKWILSGAQDNTIKKWDIRTGKCVATWLGHSASVKHLELCSDNQFVFSISDDKSIKCWNIATGQCVKTIKISLKSIDCFVLSHDSRLGLVAGDNSSNFSDTFKYAIQKFDMQAGRCITTLPAWEKHMRLIGKIALSPDGNWALSAGKMDHALILWDTKAGKCIQENHFKESVISIVWPASNPSLIVTKMADGALSVWAFQAHPPSLHLQWSSKSWGLQASNCQLVGSYGLTFLHQQIFSEIGAKVQVSSKSSDVIIKSRQASIPYNPESPHHNIFGSSITIKPDKWVVSIARQKNGAGKLHAFLLLESIEAGHYCIRRIDYVLEQRHQLLSPDSTTGRSGDIFGQALIEIKQLSLFDAQPLATYCYGIPTEITEEQGLQLMENIRADQSQLIAYCKMGSGSIYKMFRMKNALEHHNCLSWCNKQLEKIRVNMLERTWLSALIDFPQWDDESPTDTSEKCVTM